MQQTLILQLDDRVFAVIQQQAENLGIPLEEFAASLLAQQFPPMPQQDLTGMEKSRAKANFERHFGRLHLGSAISLENESIDEDLAQEYSNPHGDL